MDRRNAIRTLSGVLLGAAIRIASREAGARYALLAAASLALPASVRADTVDARCVVVARGTSGPRAELPCTFSQRQGHVAIQRADGVRHELSPADSPGNYVDQDGRAAVRLRGLGARGLIFRLARETVYVYWDLTGMPSGRVEGPFDRVLAWQGVRFRVRSANDSSINRLEIEVAGPRSGSVERRIDGTVSGAEVADLDANGAPELYVYTTSAGSGSYGSVLAFIAEPDRPLAEASLPPLEQRPGAARGYQGHDAFAIGEGALLRRFPVYRPGDANAAPGGGMRQLQYRLERAASGWALRLDRIVEY